MLVISRKIGQKLIITMPGGKETTLVVSKVRGGTVTIGIEAPSEVRVIRNELLDRERKQPA